MDWLNYREKLGIGFSDKNVEKYFFNKIFNKLNVLKICSDNFEVSEAEYFCFCEITGCQMRVTTQYGFDGSDRYNICLAILQEHSNNIKDFLAYYVAFCNSIDGKLHDGFGKQSFLKMLEDDLSESHIQYELFHDSDGVFIFPKGAEELDDALISAPLVWLSEYSLTHTAFTKALKEYAKASPENASDIADKFRKALETFMQEFFNTGKSLENCKAIYGAYLAEQGVPKEITGNLETLLQAYTNYINNYAKHKDRTQVNVLEYLLYQTGNIIRLLITLKKREKEEI